MAAVACNPVRHHAARTVSETDGPHAAAAVVDWRALALVEWHLGQFSLNPLSPQLPPAQLATAQSTLATYLAIPHAGQTHHSQRALDASTWRALAQRTDLVLPTNLPHLQATPPIGEYITPVDSGIRPGAAGLETRRTEAQRSTPTRTVHSSPFLQVRGGRLTAWHVLFCTIPQLPSGPAQGGWDNADSQADRLEKVCEAWLQGAALAGDWLHSTYRVCVVTQLHNRGSAKGVQRGTCMRYLHARDLVLRILHTFAPC